MTQPTTGGFRVYVAEGPRNFNKLEDAITFAEEVAESQAVEYAKRAGAEHIETVFMRQDNRVDDPIDGSVFFDSKISVIASGRPQ